MREWLNKRVLILGAARQGTALAKYLVGQGAQVVLSDAQPAEKLQDALASLRDLKIEYALGGHPHSLLDRVELVCLSGGVPINLPIVLVAAKRGLPLSNDSQIFFEIAPCQTLGITGSAGKTTTTTLTGKMVEASGRQVWVGGNIGYPLIGEVARMGNADLAVVELSSFQLEQMTLSPHIAGVLNITPNHLDRHGTMEAYINAKSHVLAYQTPDDIGVLGWDDEQAHHLQKMAHGRLWWFSKAHAEEFGTHTRHEIVYLRDGEREYSVCKVTDIRLRGEHNLLNVLAACALSSAAGVKPPAMREVIRTFTGVAHRLEFVREVRGAKWYNDLIATAPERVMAAIHSFSEPLVVLLGGRDKKLPWLELLQLLREREAKVIVFGEAGELIAKYAAQEKLKVTLRRTLAEAVAEAARMTRSGEVVLLSPGCTSFDEFKDFEERGRVFVELVNKL